MAAGSLILNPGRLRLFPYLSSFAFNVDFFLSLRHFYDIIVGVDVRNLNVPEILVNLTSPVRQTFLPIKLMKH